jgi:hypothetical protein
MNNQKRQEWEVNGMQLVILGMLIVDPSEASNPRYVDRWSE